MRQRFATAEAQNQGARARRAGLARDVNHWAEGTALARAFDRGWREEASE